jgi:4-oxalocrotonate tautomerase
MPEIVVYLAEGRAKVAKQAMMKDITDAVVRNLGVSPDAVVVQIVESSKENKSKGGIPFSER